MNYGDHFSHVYDDIVDQSTGGTPCLTCKSSLEGRLLGCKPTNDEGHGCVDLLMTGSPCNPFSQQRNKRFHEDSVQSHHQANLTMESVVHMYMKHEPRVGVLEQVYGFCMPISKSDKTTPKELFLGTNCQVDCQVGWVPSITESLID